MKPTLTLYTDASFVKPSRAAGWAGWAAGTGDRHGIELGAPITSKPPDNDIAEAIAISSALVELDAHHYLRPGDAIEINSDSLKVLGWLWPGLERNGLQVRRGLVNGNAMKVWPATSERALRYAFRIEIQMLTAAVVLRKAGVTDVILRHVRGHDTSGRITGEINADCDRRARKFRMEAM